MPLDITELAVSILTLLIGIVTWKGIPYLKANYNKDQLEKALMWGEIAVNAAEQLAKSGVIKLSERKEYAMNLLKKKGINLDIDQLSAIIESFVYGLPDMMLKEDPASSTPEVEDTTAEDEECEVDDEEDDMGDISENGYFEPTPLNVLNSGYSELDKLDEHYIET